MNPSYLMLGLIQDGPVSGSLQQEASAAFIGFDALQPDDLNWVNVTDWPAVIIGSHADQIALVRQRAGLVRYLNQGGLVIWNGAIAHSPLPELLPFVPMPVRTLAYLTVTQLKVHPLFSQVPAEALTYRKGVAGFWGRGHNPPPPGATPVNGLGPQPEEHPVDWYWARPQGGAFFMHAGNDLFTFADSTELRHTVLENLRNWVLAHHNEGRLEGEIS
ncbi:MAG: hypothetical protein ABJ000_15945 [Saccharospirillum sp.]|uniref:hypothetical protein n=1 Tax=Saccharospirillum sp. TaxID=2033801 RepID=UPI003299127F